MANTAGYKLRSAAHKYLDDTECTTLKICIRRFKETQSVLGLCTALQKFLDTPENVHIMALIFPMIPEDLRVDFDNLSRLQFEYYNDIRPKIVEKYKLGSVKKKASPPRGRERKSTARVLLPVEQLHNIAEAREYTMSTFKGRPQGDLGSTMPGLTTTERPSRGGKEHKRSKTYHASEQASRDEPSPTVFREPEAPVSLNTSHASSDSTPRVRLGELKQASSPKSLQVRRITLERREGQSFGFCIRGGVDLNTGIFVSEVDPGGQAERKGMRVGERILKVNNIVFKNISHSQAVVAIKSAPRIHVYLAPLGQMPGSTGTTPRIGDGVGSTLGSQLQLPSSDTINTEASLPNCRKITILAEEDGWLGFSIRGGMDQNLDITVANVDPSSPADRSGLKKGEHILKVNGAAVEGLTHMQIVNLVLSSSIVVLHVKKAQRTSQSSTLTSRMRGRHVSSSSSTGSRGCKKDAAPATDPEFDLSCSARRRGPTSPIPETALEIAQFVAEMQSTPPVCSSTPLPPEDDPRLIKNRNQCLREIYNSTATDEAAILQMMRESGEGIPPLHLSNLSERTDGDRNSPSPRSASGKEGGKEGSKKKSPRRRSKFDQGTIRLNLANGADKGIMKEAKLINIDIDSDNGKKSERRHVKDLFEQKQETNLRHSPSPNHRRQKSARELPEGYTPRMNILSSPYAHYDRENLIQAQSLSPSSKDLRSAIGTASSQISSDLTGKNKAMTTCNVPPSPHNGSSPVSKFIQKVLRRGSGGKELLKAGGKSTSNLAGSTESVNSGCGTLRLMGKMGPESSLHCTAYDLVQAGAADLSSTDGD